MLFAGRCAILVREQKGPKADMPQNLSHFAKWILYVEQDTRAVVNNGRLANFAEGL